MDPERTPKMRRREDVAGAGFVALLVAIALALGVTHGPGAGGLASGRATFTVPAASFSFDVKATTLRAASDDGRTDIGVALSALVDGVEHPLSLSSARLPDRGALVADGSIELGASAGSPRGSTELRGTLELRTEARSGVLDATLTLEPADAGAAAHVVALRAVVAPAGRGVFVPGAGEVADFGAIEARAVVVEDERHPLAILRSAGALTVALVPEPGDPHHDHHDPAQHDPAKHDPAQHDPAKHDPAHHDVGPRLAASAHGATGEGRLRVGLGLLLGGSPGSFWGDLAEQQGQAAARVRGVVLGTTERAHVLALDAEGRPLLRVAAGQDGRFDLEAPVTAVRWYASVEAPAAGPPDHPQTPASHTSAPVSFEPGTPWDLRLDISPGGELRARVVDADTGEPLVARLLVHGIDGTLDPNFGPDYRGSGAGPLMDLRSGEATTPLPKGRYRVSATRGIEWSIDAEVVEVASGHTKDVALALRHVVQTPRLVGCDLHVHARPSFDSPVTPEDRVTSLVAAGVDFAVPTEHNVVGDYGPALELLHLEGQLGHVTGVEVTTQKPSFGHFGVFPYPRDAKPPPFRKTTPRALFAAAHRGDPSRVVQVNHPRLTKHIGYFNAVGFDRRSGRVPKAMRTDFDTLEVYNGYEMFTRGRVDEVMRDWFALLNLGQRYAATGSSDSHRIQYQWAGYPRTYVFVDDATDEEARRDTSAIIASIKKGRGFVTSGPMLDLEVTDGARTSRPGDDARVAGGALRGRLRVRAAPWIDVTSVEIVAGIPAPPPRGREREPGRTEVVFRASIPSRPTKLGDEGGTLAEAAARTVRYETDLAVDLPEGTRWILAVARGDRPMDDALPFMKIQPLGFTNPIWIHP